MKLAITAAVAALLFTPSPRTRAAAAADTWPSDVAEPLDTAYPADSILGDWWSQGKEGRLKIVR